MTEKWTKGPWVADDFCMNDDNAVRVGTTDGTPTYYHTSATICECNIQHPALGADLVRGEPAIGIVEAEANARLIAAAPELYEALAMVRDADNDRRSDGFPVLPPMPRAKIDAALAKAEGRQP